MNAPATINMHPFISAWFSICINTGVSPKVVEAEIPTPSMIYPTFAILEYASILFRLDCCIAYIEPKIMAIADIQQIISNTGAKLVMKFSVNTEKIILISA